MKILIINGPNLNMLGKRDPAIYGSDTLKHIRTETDAAIAAANLGITTEWYQSNVEGEIVTKIQTTDADALLINGGAYSHYSLAIHDALEIRSFPKIELHISNIFRREEYRRHSVLSEVCDGVIVGLGKRGYAVAILTLANMLQDEN